MIACKICQGETATVFSKMVLGKHEVAYHRCGSCGFVQTDEPFWLEETYASVINASAWAAFVVGRGRGAHAVAAALL